MLLTIGRPRPVPPYKRFVVLEACEKASQMVSYLSFGIPIPESITSVSKLISVSF
mgnify:CR=1 FL=1